MKLIYSLCFVLLSFGIQAQSAKAPVKVSVKGFNGKPYANDKVLFVGQKSRQTLSGVTNQAGQFVIQLPCGDIYDIRIQSIGDEIEYNTLEIPAVKPGEYFQEAELVIEYDPGTTFSFTNLQFETCNYNILISVLRFCALPCVVLLSAIGLLSPKPFATILPASIP